MGNKIGSNNSNNKTDLIQNEIREEVKVKKSE